MKEEHLRARTSLALTSDSHTLSPFNSLKTDVHTDKPSLHPSLGEEEQGEKEETILHLPTLPASQHTN